MAALSPASKRAIANLRAFATPPTSYYKCPLTRRAAVLILLFADRRGDLRVVLTIRSSGLKNYAGQAALPGGKADTLQETPWLTARREAFEEIGLPMRDENFPPGYTVEHLTELPCNLAMTELGVRPCVAYLHAPAASASNRTPDAARDLLPKLDAKEVAAVFTAPFHNFLREEDEDPEQRKVEGEWYKGSWHSWNEKAWRMHNFSVPVTSTTAFLAKRPESYTDPRPTTPNPASQPAAQASPAAFTPAKAGLQKSSSLEPPLPRTFYRTSGDALAQPRYRVFGMTARILVDAARVAYGEEPQFEHNSHFGDEEMIERLLRIGRLGEKKKEGEVLTKEVMSKAREVKM